MTKREFGYLMLGFFLCHAVYLTFFYTPPEEMLPDQIRIIEFTPTPYHERTPVGLHKT